MAGGAEKCFPNFPISLTPSLSQSNYTQITVTTLYGTTAAFIIIIILLKAIADAYTYIHTTATIASTNTYYFFSLCEYLYICLSSPLV